MADSASMTAEPRSFFGEPLALAYLSFTEAWERFSYYGMGALMVLYMTQQLLLPGHVEQIAGFPGFRHTLEAVFGPMTTLALASQIYGLYTGFIYFTPVFGGLIADRWTGKRVAVALGAVMMSAGHLAMAFDVSFLIALLLLILGCGLLKGNISTQVGALYASSDSAGRSRGFSIYSIGINVGAVAGPLGCGLLAQLYGWHAGFALAGVLMLLGLVTYLAGYRVLGAETPRGADRPVHAPLTREQWRVVFALTVVMLLTIFQSIAYYQNGNMNLIWIDRAVDLDLLGWRMPVAWFGSIDPFVSIVAVAPLLALWRWQARHGGEPSELSKIAAGAWMAAGANLLLVAGCLLKGRVPILVPITYDVILGIAFLYYWPIAMALVSRAAPPALKATMMGLLFMSFFVSDIALGWIGSFYDRMSPAEFWGVHAGISAAGAVLCMLLARPLGHILGTEA